MSVKPATDAALAAPLFGEMIANAMYGALICQTAWYFKAFPKDPIYLKLLVALICVSETAGLILAVFSSWFYFIRRGIGVDPIKLITCTYWSASAYFIPTEFTCLLAEILFIKRMWGLANHKNYVLAIVVLIPFLVGWAFTIDYLQAIQRHFCFPQRFPSDFVFLMSFGSRVVSSGVVTATMCFLLFRRASPLTSTDLIQTKKMLRVVKYLAIGSLSTGLIMWCTAISFTVTLLVLKDSPIPFGIYGVRGSFFANAVLVSLNDRARYRKILTETIPLQNSVVFPSTFDSSSTNPTTAEESPSV